MQVTTLFQTVSPELNAESVPAPIALLSVRESVKPLTTLQPVLQRLRKMIFELTTIPGLGAMDGSTFRGTVTRRGRSALAVDAPRPTSTRATARLRMAIDLSR